MLGHGLYFVMNPILCKEFPSDMGTCTLGKLCKSSMSLKFCKSCVPVFTVVAVFPFLRLYQTHQACQSKSQRHLSHFHHGLNLGLPGMIHLRSEFC